MNGQLYDNGLTVAKMLIFRICCNKNAVKPSCDIFRQKFFVRIKNAKCRKIRMDRYRFDGTGKWNRGHSTFMLTHWHPYV